MQPSSSTKGQKYLIGNWKANKTIKETYSWIKLVKQAPVIKKNLTVVLCPAFIHLPMFKKEIPELVLGCQNLSPYGDGAYTGAITARMLSGLVNFVILGHSERCRYFNESLQKVSLKAIQAVDYKITPIIAVDKNNWRRQFNILDNKIIQKSIFMYEPSEAISQQTGSIGKGDAAPLDEVKEMINKIKKETKAKKVIYGGSIKSNNIKEFLEEPIIDGVLPGSASLNAEEWLRMITIANSVV